MITRESLKANDAVVGVDIGTTYTKITLVDLNGSLIHQSRYKSATFCLSDGVDYSYAYQTWARLETAIREHSMWASARRHTVKRIAISAISPVLVYFSTSNPEATASMPYWRLANIDGDLTGRAKARRRADFLRDRATGAGINGGVISDLIGYINFRLTGHVTMNTITLAELCAPDQCAPVLDVDLLRPIETLTPCITHGLFEECCAGASDSYCAAIGVGAIKKGDELLYLGTFGSLLRINDCLADCLNSSIAKLPYEWVFSSPRFGAMIENISEATFPGAMGKDALQKLDEEALLSPPGANQVFFHIPRLYSDGTETWCHGFVNNPRYSDLTPLRARAVLEALPIALLATGTRRHGDNGPVYVNGGGATSLTWAKVLADCLLTTVYKPASNSYANGAVLLALLSQTGGEIVQSDRVEVTPSINARHQVEQTVGLAKTWYETHP